MKRGILLINLGTPDAPDTASVRRYLREFLADRRVISLPVVLRYLILYAFILPFRPRKSAHAYQAIWTKEGSPLLVHSRNLVVKLQTLLGNEYQVVLGMRYGKPSLVDAVKQLSDCEQLTILPLYPQYASAATGSSIEETLKLLAPKTIQPSLTIIRDFHRHPAFINAQSAIIKPYLDGHDFLLFSFHGIPQQHLKDAGCQTMCRQSCPSSQNNPVSCYRAQCFTTSELLAQTLGLTSEQYGVAFQSRLGKTPWITPYTDNVLPELVDRGVKRLAIACPSFVADCLETLEEIGMRAQQQWKSLGGETLTLIPCVNDNPQWIKGILDICGIPAIKTSGSP
ncbi:ferrochelatase [Legionella spiritensis]|uniref:ferrochelatase n=1 Tax=Legionella spiritensis TaxID=452 RepID=UPI000F6D2A9E|nr:ferrochelatase [Legionella spiritensis]VEG90813.1 ferrochelatase [Legionella spiritensis]